MSVIWISRKIIGSGETLLLFSHRPRPRVGQKNITNFSSECECPIHQKKQEGWWVLTMVYNKNVKKLGFFRDAAGEKMLILTKSLREVSLFLEGGGGLGGTTDQLVTLKRCHM